jgi:UDP-N-acetylglucosamine/UDP-N-acetylgalactosamine diphosphorylase
VGALRADETGHPGIDLEVSPLFGYDDDSFAASWARRTPAPRVEHGVYLE